MPGLHCGGRHREGQPREDLHKTEADPRPSGGCRGFPTTARSDAVDTSVIRVSGLGELEKRIPIHVIGSTDEGIAIVRIPAPVRMEEQVFPPGSFGIGRSFLVVEDMIEDVSERHERTPVVAPGNGIGLPHDDHGSVSAGAFGQLEVIQRMPEH